MTWGLFFGYFVFSSKIILIQNKASFVVLSRVSLISYPFSFKFLLAPLADNYYLKSMGKRKTYIVLSNYLACLLLFISYFFIDNWFKNLNIIPLMLVGFLICLCISMQSVAVNAWPADLIHPNNKRFVGPIDTSGQKFDELLSYNIFIWLHSADFCNEYLYETPQKEGILSNSSMILIIFIVLLSVTVMIHALKKEEISSEREFKYFCEYWGTLKGFYENKNILWLIFFTLTMNFFLGFIENGQVILLKKGFSPTVLSTIDLMANLSNGLFGFLGSYLSKQKKEFTYLYYCILGLFIFDIFFYFFVCYYDDQMDQDLAIFLYSCYNIGFSWVFAMKTAFFISFVLKNADEKMAATFTVSIYSISNLKKYMSISFSLFLMQSLSFKSLGIMGIAISTIYYIVFTNKILSFDGMKKEHWKLSFN